MSVTTDPPKYNHCAQVYVPVRFKIIKFMGKFVFKELKAELFPTGTETGNRAQSIL